MPFQDAERFPITEEENPRTTSLSSQSSLEIVSVMNGEDEGVAVAVRAVLPDVARAVDGIVARLRAGGRLFYVGTGTSGRLGVLDAAELPATFCVAPDLVQAVIAGGYEARHRPGEASEGGAPARAHGLGQTGITKTDEGV